MQAQGEALSPGGVKAPHGEHSSGQLARRLDGSVALQWVSTVKTDSQSQVPVGPSGKRVCWQDWCWVRCDRASCPCHHVDTEEELSELLPDGKWPIAVWALSCEHMGLRSIFPHMGDMFQAQLWLRAILASMYKLTGTMGKCGASSVVHPVRVQWSMGDDVGKYDGPVHPQGREVTQLGSIQLAQPASWLWTIVDWGENYGSVVTACVSLVGSSILRKEPQELEQLALQFTTEVAQDAVPASCWALVQEMRSQLEVRVGKGSGLLTPDVWRIWLSMCAPGTALVLLQVHAVGAVRPLVFRVPGVPVQRYVGAMMIDSHFFELQCNRSAQEVESWLEELPMFVPTLWCFEPAAVSKVVGSRFGCGPCGSTDESAAACVNTNADSLWRLGQFEYSIGMEGSRDQGSLKDLEIECWPEDCSAEFQQPVSSASIPGCGKLRSTEQIAADVWSSLESAESWKPVGSSTVHGVKALMDQGSGLEAEEHQGSRGLGRAEKKQRKSKFPRGMPDLADDDTSSGDESGSEPDLVDDDTSSDDESDSDVCEEELRAAGATRSRANLDPGGENLAVEWESMWDEVLDGISDGRELTETDKKKLEKLKRQAVEHAGTWDSQIGKQLASDRCLQQKYLRNTATWVYICLEAADLVGGKHQWPPLLEASIRDGTGSFTGEVELTHLREYFTRGVVSPEQVDLMVNQVVKGQALKFRERRVRFRGKMLPSCKGYEREIAAQNWLDASRGQVIIAGPQCLPAMDAGEIMCHPNARVPKNDTATGTPTGKGRLIAHLSFQPIKADVLKWLSRNQSVERPFGTYNLARHKDIARQWCQLNDQPLGGFIAAQKNDGDCYFRRWYMAVMNIGDIASEFAGHTVIDRSLVFGLGPSPEVTHFGGTEPMEKAMNGAWVELDEEVAEAANSPEVAAAEAVLRTVKEIAAKKATAESRKPTDLIAAKNAIGVVVGNGYLGWSERGTLKAPDCVRLSTAVRLGPQFEWQFADEVEIEYPEADAYLKEQDPLWNIPVEDVDADVVLNLKRNRILTDQEVIDAGAENRVIPTSGVMYVDDQICLALVCMGVHLAVRSHAAEGIVARLGKCGLSMKAVHKEMVYRVVQNVIGQLCDCIQGEWRPTPARISKLDRYLKEYLVKVQERKITAGEAYAPYSLGLWVGIGAWWLKAFIHGLKTPLNGFDTGSMNKDDLVVPNRKGLSVADAWIELEDHVLSLIALIALRKRLPWRTSMVQMLEVAERLVEKSANFMRVETDACIWGAGGVNEKLRQFFRVVHPEWVRKEIRHAMDNGLDQQTAKFYTIALVELAAVFVSHFLWAGRTDEMERVLDIWNVVDNTNTEAWCEKLWAGPVMASRFLRGLAVIGMRRKYNAATSGERTKAMVFADPLSRVWEDGKYDPTAMDDFATACSGVGILEGMKEVVLDDCVINQLVFQKRGTEVGSLLEQLARMVTVADRPMQPTVPWDSKCDVPLEHCLKELPVAGAKAAEGQGTQEPEEAVLLESPTSEDLKSHKEAVCRQEEASQGVSSEGHGSKLEELPAAGAGQEIRSLQPLGTSQVKVWDVNAHREANAEAVREWQMAVEVKFHSAAPAQVRKCPQERGDGSVNQAGFTREELEPLLEQRHWWKHRPTLTTICYGILGSTMGWVVEGFDFVAGSEIEPWCVDHASRLFPQMKQLGDLESLSASNMEPSDVLIVGTTCTAVSILGMQRGLADIKMEHMLMVARWAVKVGFKAMVFEMVPNILGFDQGAIQIALENILREAGYEVSRRVENLWVQGGAAVRERLYTIATNPCYGKHADLREFTEELRQPEDPKCVLDVMDPVGVVDPGLFHSVEQVRWKQGGISVREGKPCWAGSMYGGGIGYRGIPGRVLLGVGALTTVIASGNVGAVLAKQELAKGGQWYLRELAAHELKKANTLCTVLELPVDHKAALRAVGNCEPPRMAQSMARSVIGPWLEQSEGEAPGRVPVKTPSRTEPVGKATMEEVTSLGEKPLSVRDQMSKLRPRVRTGLSEKSTEHKPVQVQRKRSQQARYQAMVEAHFKEQWHCGGLKPCGTNVSSEAQDRIAAAMEGPGGFKVSGGQIKRKVGQKSSGVMKLYPELDPQDKRSRLQMRKEDPRIVAARVKVEAASIRTSTSSKYSGQWQEYVAHSEDCEEDPFQAGKHERQVTEHLVYFVLYRFEFAGNAFGTIRGYLSAIRWYFLEAELPDPTKGNWLLRVMRGIKNLRGAVNRKLPVTLDMLKWIWARRGVGLSKARAVATAAVIQVFFLLRISDFGAQDSRTVSEFILKVHQVKFWKGGVRCKWSDEPDEVSIEGDGDKMSNQPWYRNHFATGSDLCPVRALAEWFCLIDGKVASGCPLFTVPPEVGERVQPGERADSLCVNRSDICQAIKAAAVANGDKAASYSSHSGRIGGATLLLQAGASVNTIKLAGRWKGDTWSIYSRMTSTAMYGVAADMIGASTKKQVNADNVRVR